jgi:hypothetical protein
MSDASVRLLTMADLTKYGSAAMIPLSDEQTSYLMNAGRGEVAGWYTDPLKPNSDDARWWGGDQWTGQVRSRKIPRRESAPPNPSPTAAAPARPDPRPKSAGGPVPVSAHPAWPQNTESDQQEAILIRREMVEHARTQTAMLRSIRNFLLFFVIITVPFVLLFVAVYIGSLVDSVFP